MRMQGPIGSGDRNSPFGNDDGVETSVGTGINPINLHIEQLKRLKDSFMIAGVASKLSLDQFVEALSANQPQAATKVQRDQWHSELCTLFRKIDASCTQTVDWEEFTNYMLLHMPGFNATDGVCELSQNPMIGENFSAAWGSGHTDMINDVCVVPDLGVAGGGGGTNSGAGGGLGQRRYVTVGRDGFVKVWLPDLRLHREIDVGLQRSWLSSCCWMPTTRRLAVASSRFKIYFYDGSFSQQPLAFIDHKDSTPLCLGHTQANENEHRERDILMVGDNNGYVTVYAMDDDWADQQQGSEEPMTFKTKPQRTRYHGDNWVTKVGFVTELQAMVTCGLDGDIYLCDVHSNKQKDPWTSAIKVHKKGVHCWTWCASYKFFASGGLDRQVVIWNPYTQKAVVSLQGHNAPVMDVLVNENQHQLVSLSVDKVVKVWDIRNYRCIQTFTDKTEYKPEDRLTCMAFDPEGPALVLCSSTLNVLPVNVKVETSRTHLAPIVGALYNDCFHQIVSGDNTGSICVWDVRTGNLEFDFKVSHQDNKLTCMAFDHSNRRLYTGGEDGAVKVWNFSSGEDLRTYTMPRPSEIVGLLWAREGPNNFIVGLAWDRKIYVWPDQKKQTVEVQYVLEDNSGDGHIDDVFCLCRFSEINGLLATGGDDGYINFWRIQDNDARSANSRKYRLQDTTPATPLPGVHFKQGGNDTKATRRKKHGKGHSIVGQEGEIAAIAGALGNTSGKGEIGSSSGTSSSKYVNNFRMSVGVAARGLESVNEDVPGVSQPHSPGISTAVGKDLQGEHSSANEWPEELGLEDFEDQRRTDGVEKMIHLQHHDVLVSAHSDGIMRVWSIKKAEFLSRLELLAPVTPKPPPPPEDKDRLSAEAPVEKNEPKTSFASSSSSTGQPGTVREASGDNAGYPRLGADGVALVNAQPCSVTALHSDVDNRWLFTGDNEGWVRSWNLAAYKPGQRYLIRVFEFQPHRQPVTHLQYFELDGEKVVMSASADGTIALCTMEGYRIGTFSSKGPHWRLADRSTWIESPPKLDDGPWKDDQDTSNLSISPRRVAKSEKGGRHYHGRAAAGTAGTSTSGRRTDIRSGQARSRTTVAPQAHTSLFFIKLSNDNPPDLTVPEQERQYLAKLTLGRDS